jgi:hypothetical protein
LKKKDIMKNLKIYGLLAMSTLLLVSCGKEWFEDYQPDPTRPLEVSVDVLLPSAMAYYAMAQGDVVPRLTGIFMQQMTGADRQSLAHNRYAQIGESDFDVVWGDNGYAGGMKDLYEIIEISEEQGFTHYTGVSRIMMAQYLGLFTDLWGDIPYRQALQDVENLNPAYDSQQQIYADIISLLDQGIADCQSTSIKTPGSDDYYYAGDMSKWVKYANSLKARYLNHLSKKPTYDPAAILTAVSSGFVDNSEDCLQPYGTAKVESNPWYQFTAEDRVGYIEQFGFMYTMMEGKNDPRIPFYRSDDLLLMPFWGSANSPLNIMTYSELKFIEAEAISRQGGDARPALEAAIAANMDRIGVSSSDRDIYIAALPATTDLELIMTEKYVATFSHYETWTDWRRTGFPGISVYPDANLSEIPRRLPYSESERLYNNNFINLTFPDNFLQRVWWDQP